jgi:hypothetical protein
MKMRKIASLFGMALMMCSMFVVAGCGSSSGTKKQKGIVLQEGDRATVTNANGYTTIEFPAELSGDDVALYDTDLLGYLLKSNAPISTSGSEYDTYRIYYYMHNSKEWLHLGNYANPYEIQVSRIKKIRIAQKRQRLRDFVDEMPLMANSKEKKNDQGFQDEISFGNNYYIFIEIELKD